MVLGIEDANERVAANREPHPFRVSDQLSRRLPPQIVEAHPLARHQNGGGGHATPQSDSRPRRSPPSSRRSAALQAKDRRGLATRVPSAPLASRRSASSSSVRCTYRS